MAEETDRLENLWADAFGDSYTMRNQDGFFLRAAHWKRIALATKPATVLEVGCNAGHNLKYIGSASKAECYGIDINKSALRKAHIAMPGLNLVYGRARDLPFKDAYFDLVFTCGVLIHQPEESLRAVMREVIRCSKKYVLAMEYFRPTRSIIPYRDQKEALFGDDYAGIYQRELGLKEVAAGFLKKDEGFDGVTWSLMEKA